MIQLKQASIQRGIKPILDHASLELFPKHKIAIIGANGCGKSTLFSALKAEISLDSGDLYIPKDWRIVAVEQEVNVGDGSAIEYVIEGNKELTFLREQLANAEHLTGEQIAEVHEQLAIQGHYEVESKAAIILAGLGFSNESIYSPVKQFSGGWQMRLNLARALLCPSDLLLLDEPTNHLDLDAIIWLEDWLKTYSGTLLLISHDQLFIDNTVQEVVSFEQLKLEKYTGGYSAFEKQKALKIQLAAAEHEKQQAKRQHLESFINRFKAKASKAKQAQSRIKQLEKMQELLPVRQSADFQFEFLIPEKLPNPLMSMDKLELGYDQISILNEIQFNLVPGSRIGLLGKNGAGKSTFMKFLAGKLKPMSGDLTASNGLSIGYFTQYQIDALDFDDSPLAHIQRLSPKTTEQQIRDYLGGFGFHGDQAVNQIINMSGGEKARLMLAILVWKKPNLLLLDEPTNHLDISVRQALTFALQGFAGALVLVSHDRYLLESVCDDFYLIDNQKLKPFKGDLEDYKKWILQSQKQVSDRASLPKDNTIDRKTQRKYEAELRQKLSPLKKQLASVEKQISKENAVLESIESKLTDTELYQSERKSELTDLISNQAKVKKQQSLLEEQWLELSDQIEQIEAGHVNNIGEL